MKTAEEIIAYLEAELAEATDMHEQAKGNNAHEALFYLTKLNTIMHLLENIKGEESETDSDADINSDMRVAVYFRVGTEEQVKGS